MGDSINSTWCNAVEGIIGMPMKNKQRDVLQELLNHNHVFAVLPTGYGKSVCFGTFPAAYLKLHPEEEAIALVISPLNALTTSHVENWNEKGVKSIALKPLSDKDMTESTIQAVKNGDYSLLFASPEIIHKDPWWRVLRGLRNKIKLLAIDEAHCLCKWGTTFRPDFLRVVQLRAILPKAVTLALTATATTVLVTSVMTELGLTDRMKTVTLCPDRPEIFLKMEKVGPELDDSLSWYVQLLEELQEEAPKAIIYASTVDSVIKIYFHLCKKLGKKAVKDRAVNDVNMRFTEMFHGKTDKESQSRIISNFRQPESILRCVVATIAFGMGIDIPNVRYVLHWGPAKDTLSYWQEVGRCSRDGLPGEANTYIPPRSKDKRIIQQDMLTVIQDSMVLKSCLRKNVLSNMKVDDAVNQIVPSHLCCFNCQ